MGLQLALEYLIPDRFVFGYFETKEVEIVNASATQIAAASYPTVAQSRTHQLSIRQEGKVS